MSELEQETESGRGDIAVEIARQRELARLLPLSDHQVILVGSNPLPCLVAALALAPRKVSLVATKQMARPGVSGATPLLTHLVNALTENGFEVEIAREIGDSASPDEVRKAMRSVSELRSTGLNYTGGTKSMAVHAYAEWIASGADPTQASYLSADPPALVIGGGVRVPPIDLRAAPRVELTKLARLHGLTPKSRKHPSGFRTEARDAELSRILFGVHQTRWQEKQGLVPLPNLCGACGARLFKKADVEGCGHLAMDDAWRPVADAVGAVDFTFGGVLRGIEERIGKPWDRALKYLEGEWLEDIVLETLGALAEDDPALHSIGTELRWIVPPTGGSGQTPDFEVDASVMRGHTFFGISCTADAKELVKLKLFEVSRRAIQLGGDHARFALVCLAPSTSIAKLAAELSANWASPTRILVAGGDDVFSVGLDGVIRDWITQAQEGGSE
ncbi:MAG: hypothetical protein WEG36_07295 [Gemmatimonadota bacterium]